MSKGNNLGQVTRWKSTDGKTSNLRKEQIYDSPQRSKDWMRKEEICPVRTQTYILHEAGINSGLKDAITEG